MNKQRIIIFEGITGSGKSTLTKMLAERLGDRARLIHEPYFFGTDDEKIKVYKWLTEEGCKDCITNYRANFYKKASLSKYEYLILDRSFISGYAYQGKLEVPHYFHGKFLEVFHIHHSADDMERSPLNDPLDYKDQTEYKERYLKALYDILPEKNYVDMELHEIDTTYVSPEKSFRDILLLTGLE